MIENRRKSNLSALALATALAVSGGGYAYAADMPLKAPPPPKPVPFFFVNDTSVSATWYFNSTDPGVSGGSDVVPGGNFGQRNTFYRAQGSVDHFDVWEYGTNLIHLELDQYGKKDPILGEPGAVGSREFFGFTRSTIGFNELTHSKAFSNFLFNDVGFEGGFTAGVQNNYLAEQTTQYLVGLNFDIAIPKQFGTLLVGVLARKEFTHNEFNACGPPGFGDAQGPAAGCQYLHHRRALERDRRRSRRPPARRAKARAEAAQAARVSRGPRQHDRRCADRKSAQLA